MQKVNLQVMKKFGIPPKIATWALVLTVTVDGSPIECQKSSEMMMMLSLSYVSI